MKRLAATLLVDIKNQARNRLYYIGIGVATGIAFPPRYLVPDEYYDRILPAFFLIAPGGTTYLFVAGMILYEKSERTLDAVIVTPLRLGEYLASKVVTLAGFATLESAIILLIVAGVSGYNPVVLLLGMVIMGVMYTLVGIAQVVRNNSVTDFLIPGAVVVGIAAQLPLLNTLDLAPSPIWYVIPTHGPLLLMQAAFEPIETWQWVYALGYSTFVVIAMWVGARSQFTRHIVQRGQEA